MIFPILALVVAILVLVSFIYAHVCDSYSITGIGDWVFGILVGLVMGFFAFMLTFSIGFIPHNIWGEKSVVDKMVDIVAVHSRTGVEGSAGGFLVFSCRIKDIDYFTFYHRTDENSYEKTKIKADNTTIHETDEDPRVEWKEKETYSEIWVGEHTSSKMIGKHHLYIPKGSIQREFILR